MKNRTFFPGCCRKGKKVRKACRDFSEAIVPGECCTPREHPGRYLQGTGFAYLCKGKIQGRRGAESSRKKEMTATGHPSGHRQYHGDTLRASLGVFVDLAAATPRYGISLDADAERVKGIGAVGTGLETILLGLSQFLAGLILLAVAYAGRLNGD